MSDNRLARRIADLEAENAALRAELERERASRRPAPPSRWQTKLDTHHHYAPRPLIIPQRYRAEPIPAAPPSIAIVTPSFNQAAYIDATITSVLEQDYPSLAYHVQDAGSRDGTLAILQSHAGRLSFDSRQDRGQAHAVNLGFSRLGGEIMGFLNSDDILLPGALRRIASTFAADPGLDFVYGHRICIDERGREIGRWILPPHDPSSIKWYDYIPQETLFWRRRAWEALGGLDERFQFALDWDFILRAHDKGMRFKRIPRFIGGFRVHPSQKTSALDTVGAAESEQLRRRHLGFEPTPREIRRARRGYMRRHILCERLYKLRFVEY